MLSALNRGLGGLGGGGKSDAPKPVIAAPLPDPVVIEDAKTTPESWIPPLHVGQLRAVVSTNANSDENPTPFLITAGEDRDICVVNGSTGELVRRISGFTGRPCHPGHRDKVYCLALWFNPEIQQTHIYSAGEDRAIRVWNMETGKHIQTLAQVHTEFIHSLRVCDATSQLVSASYDKSIVVWSLKTGAQMDLFRHDRVLFGCDLNPEARAVACGNGAHIYIWDLTTGRRTTTLRIHKRTVTSIAFPKPDLLISGSDDKSLCFWNPTDQVAPLLRRIDLGAPAYTLQVFNDETAFFVAVGTFGEPHCIHVYNLSGAHELLLTYRGHTNKVVDMILWSDAEGMPKLASLGWDQKLFTWDLVPVVQAIHDQSTKMKNKTSKTF